MSQGLKVLVLGGGPDRERQVSLKSAAAVAAALRRAGHEVVEGDVQPDNLTALSTPCDVVFAIMHGRWGEGGALQKIMDDRRLRYVGARTRAAAVAIDKCASKHVAQRSGVPTPEYQQIGPRTPLTIPAPLVLKPLTEGSSFGVEICREASQVDAARQRLHAHFAFGLVERFIPGREVTVGIVGDQVLPPVQITPKAAFYDFQAKYESAETGYSFDTGFSAGELEQIRDYAWKMFTGVGCRHLARVDFIVDQDNHPWFLEINTLPGFTDHSLLPMAAGKAGMDMPALCDRLVRLALVD